MTFYTGPISFLLLMPWALYHESGTFLQCTSTRPWEVAGFLLGGCCMAVCYNVAFFQCLQTISAAGTAAMGNVKVVFILVLSAIFLGELSTWPFSQYLGCVMTFGSTYWYSILRQRAAKRT